MCVCNSLHNQKSPHFVNYHPFIVQPHPELWFCWATKFLETGAWSRNQIWTVVKDIPLVPSKQEVFKKLDEMALHIFKQTVENGNVAQANRLAKRTLQEKKKLDVASWRLFGLVKADGSGDGLLKCLLGAGGDVNMVCKKV